jgi:hypothetical protein
MNVTQIKIITMDVLVLLLALSFYISLLLSSFRPNLPPLVMIFFIFTLGLCWLIDSAATRIYQTISLVRRRKNQIDYQAPMTWKFSDYLTITILFIIFILIMGFLIPILVNNFQKAAVFSIRTFFVLFATACYIFARLYIYPHRFKVFKRKNKITRYKLTDDVLVLYFKVSSIRDKPEYHVEIPYEKINKIYIFSSYTEADIFYQHELLSYIPESARQEMQYLKKGSGIPTVHIDPPYKASVLIQGEGLFYFVKFHQHLSALKKKFKQLNKLGK